MGLFKIRFAPLRCVATLFLLLAAANVFAAPKTAGTLAVNPTSIAFGSLTVSTSVTQNVVLLNTGTGNVTTSTATMSGAGFSVTGLTLPMTLAPGQSAAFQATFAPSSTGSVTGYVYLKKSNGTVLATVAMSGTGVAAIAPPPVQHSVDLNWSASPSSIIGYYVYRAMQVGGPYNRISTAADPATLFTDGSVSGGQVYYYVVTAVDANQVESAYSNESTASIPL